MNSSKTIQKCKNSKRRENDLRDSPEYQVEVGFIDLEKPAASGFLISPKSSQPANLKDTHTKTKHMRSGRRQQLPPS